MRAKPLKNAQSIALFHNTNASLESRILLATEGEYSVPNNIFLRGKDVFSHVEAY
jgi:hypothetical protein